MARKKVYWTGHVGKLDDFDQPITDTFYDAKSIMGPWAKMAPSSWTKYSFGRTGTGFGQKYQLQPNGSWIKTEG